MEDLEARLVKNNWVNPQQLELAGNEAKRLGKTIWVALIKLGILSQEDIAVFFAQESGIPYIKISDFKIPSEQIALLSEDFCRQHLVMPFCKLKDTLYVAAVNPLDTSLQDYLTSKTGFGIELLFTSLNSMQEALNANYGIIDTVFDSQKYIIKQSPLRSLVFYRESERASCDVALELEVIDEDLAQVYSGKLLASRVKNISLAGASVGLEAEEFIPKGCQVLLVFQPEAYPVLERQIRIKGEVAYCSMEKSRRYFLGIKFIAAQKQDVEQILRLCLQK